MDSVPSRTYDIRYKIDSLPRTYDIRYKRDSLPRTYGIRYKKTLTKIMFQLKFFLSVP
jgi:hypothetical protein